MATFPGGFGRIAKGCLTDLNYSPFGLTSAPPVTSPHLGFGGQLLLRVYFWTWPERCRLAIHAKSGADLRPHLFSFFAAFRRRTWIYTP